MGESRIFQRLQLSPHLSTIYNFFSFHYSSSYFLTTLSPILMPFSLHPFLHLFLNILSLWYFSFLLFSYLSHKSHSPAFLTASLFSISFSIYILFTIFPLSYFLTFLTNLILLPFSLSPFLNFFLNKHSLCYFPSLLFSYLSHKSHSPAFLTASLFSISFSIYFLFAIFPLSYFLTFLTTLSPILTPFSLHPFLHLFLNIHSLYYFPFLLFSYLSHNSLFHSHAFLTASHFSNSFSIYILSAIFSFSCFLTFLTNLILLPFSLSPFLRVFLNIHFLCYFPFLSPFSHSLPFLSFSSLSLILFPFSQISFSHFPAFLTVSLSPTLPQYKLSYFFLSHSPSSISITLPNP
jgi:hypothetical protein